MKDPGRTGALAFFAAAMLMLIAGGALAAASFPGGFDWSYMVVSALASRKHNPDGGAWFSGALVGATILLWPVATYLGGTAREDERRPRVSIAALRVGIVCGALLGVERLFVLHISDVVRKAHEVLAILTFVGLYWGVLGLHIDRARRSTTARWLVVGVVLPLIAVGISQIALYFDQRDLGWVGVGWREMGVPLWLSFAFWQWLAVAFLWLGLGQLVAADGGPRGPYAGHQLKSPALGRDASW